MGCFSFMCKECGKAILSNSYRGQSVELFLLKNGEVFQHMSGEYDSYGRVFNPQTFESIKWDKDWNDCCDLMFSNNDAEGIAAIHTECYKGVVPTTQSDSDPNQGWGENGELLFLDTSREDLKNI